MGTAQALAFPKPSLPQAFFCGRSDYFRALLDDHFRENEGLEASGGLPAITLHGLSPHVFTHVLYYIYTNHTEVRTGVGCVHCARGKGWGAQWSGQVHSPCHCGFKGLPRSSLALRDRFPMRLESECGAHLDFSFR